MDFSPLSTCNGRNNQNHPSDRARQYFEALQLGGKILIPSSEVLFSPAYGILTDKFGVTFQVFTATQQTATLYGM
jgi:uncharacterized glyoxalase superfamily protein PhnB